MPRGRYWNYSDKAAESFKILSLYISIWFNHLFLPFIWSWAISDAFSVCFLLVSGSEFVLPVPSGCGCSLSRSWTWERRRSLQQGRLEDLSGSTQEARDIDSPIKGLSMKFYAAFMYVACAYLGVNWSALDTWSLCLRWQTWGEVGTGSRMGCCVTMAFESHGRKLRNKGHQRLFGRKTLWAKLVMWNKSTYSCYMSGSSFANVSPISLLQRSTVQFAPKRSLASRAREDFWWFPCLPMRQARFNKSCFDPLT